MTGPRYEADQQKLTLRSDPAVGCVTVWLDEVLHGNYVSSEYVTGIEDGASAWTIPIPHGYFRHVSTVSIGYDSRLPDMKFPVHELVRREHDPVLATGPGLIDFASAFDGWLGNELDANGEALASAYLEAADWQTLCRLDFDEFIETLFLVVLQRMPAPETIAFYGEKFAAGRDFDRAIRRITGSDEALRLHLSHSTVNCALGDMVADKIRHLSGSPP